MSYSGVAKDGPAEGRTLHSDSNPMRIPVRSRYKPPPSPYELPPPGSGTIEVGHYVHITDHDGNGWWLWEQGWLIKLLRHIDHERQRAIAHLLG